MSVPNAQRLAPNAKTSLCLLAVIIGMGLLQTFSRQNGGGREKPGPTRGDLVLTEESLSAELAGWTRTKFTPAPPVEELADGQFWWSHQWQYSNGHLVLIVAVDQCQEFRGWHELTYCYEANGWERIEREIHYASGSDWPIVVAKFKQADGSFAILAFSLFTRDGKTPLDPPEVGDIDVVRGDFEGVWQNRMRNASIKASATDSLEAVQVQLFCVQHQRFTSIESQQVIALYQEARSVLHDSWKH